MNTYHVLAISWLLCAGCQTESFVHPQFSERRLRLQSVAVLPCRLTALRAKAFSTAPQPVPDALVLQGRLQTALVRQCRQCGFQVGEGKLDAALITATNSSRQDHGAWMWIQLTNAYDSLSCPVVRPEAPLLAAYEGADALLFTSVILVTESGGSKAFRYTVNTVEVAGFLGTLLWGGSGIPTLEGSLDRCDLAITLVEGKTGDVLWYRHVQVTPPDASGLEEAVERVFDDFPQP